MPYISLQTSNGVNQSQVNDANGNIEYRLDATENFETEVFEFIQGMNIVVINNGIVGTGGSIKLQRSADKINWTDVEKDGVDVGFTINADYVTSSIIYFASARDYGKLVYTKGSVSAGTLTIKITR